MYIEREKFVRTSYKYFYMRICRLLCCKSMCIFICIYIVIMLRCSNFVHTYIDCRLFGRLSLTTYTRHVKCTTCINLYPVNMSIYPVYLSYNI